MYVLNALNTDLYGIRHIRQGFNMKGTPYVND